MSFSALRRSITLNAKKLRAPRSIAFSRNVSNKTAIPNHQQHDSPLTGYRKYAQQFKSKPGSYMTSFAILHEITAIVPFPIIYLLLDISSVKVPFPDTVVSEGNRFINKARVHYGYEPLGPDNRTMINLVTTYGIVKALLPVRIAASAAMTPFFAERLVGPILKFVRKGFSSTKKITH